MAGLGSNMTFFSAQRANMASFRNAGLADIDAGGPWTSNYKVLIIKYASAMLRETIKAVTVNDEAWSTMWRIGIETSSSMNMKSTWGRELRSERTLLKET